MLPVGAAKPLMPGGTLSYSEQTKPSAYAKESVYSTYGVFPTYSTLPTYLGPRSGHYSDVIEKPDDKRMGAPDLNDVITPSDPQLEELTEYFLNRVPAEQKSIGAVLTIKEYGLQDLLTKFIRGKLQDDADMVKARYAGATQVEYDLAQARLQNRYSDMIRYYGGEQRLREALLRDYVGGLPEAALRASATNALQREMAEGGAGPFSVDAGGVPTVGGMDAGAMAADAEAGQLDEMEEREPVEPEEAMPSVDQTQGDISRLLMEKRELETGLEEEEAALETAETEAERQNILSEIQRLESEIRTIRLQILELQQGSSQVQTDGGMYADDVDGTADEYAPVQEGMGAEPADGPGSTFGSSLLPVPAVGGGGGMGREMPMAGPGGSSSRAKVGEIIGHQSAAAPAKAMASQDPAAAGATARQDQMGRRSRPKGQMSLAQAMGFEEEAIAEEVVEAEEAPRRKGKGRGRARVPKAMSQTSSSIGRDMELELDEGRAAFGGPTRFKLVGQGGKGRR